VAPFTVNDPAVGIVNDPAVGKSAAAGKRSIFQTWIMCVSIYKTQSDARRERRRLKINVSETFVPLYEAVRHRRLRCASRQPDMSQKLHNGPGVANGVVLDVRQALHDVNTKLDRVHTLMLIGADADNF